MTNPFPGPRGLVGYTQFTDTDGTRVEVQESSAVYVGSLRSGFDGPFCWLRLYPTQEASVGRDHMSAHLTPEMAAELITALTEWLGSTEADEEKEHRGHPAD